MEILKTKIWRTIVMLVPGGVFEMDTILWRGGFWLVPEWYETHNRKWRLPARAVPLAMLAHQGDPFRLRPPQFLLDDTIARSIFYDRLTPQEADRYGVVEAPQLAIEIPAGERMH